MLYVANQKFRFIAFYLPQFYPITENDKWWGKGFTEWFNVVKAKPRFKRHYQPRLPGELGFYDLRVSKIAKQQIYLAEKYGINAFAYYHYWFSGKRLLNIPLDNVVKTKKQKFPFCLVWANESWSRKWGPTYGSKPLDKNIGETLIKQEYSKKDNVNHIRWLIKVFNKKNYLKVNGKPVFIVYRPSLIPDLKDMAKLWRKEASRAGLKGIYLCLVHSFPEDHIEPKQVNFDAAIDFVPDIQIKNEVIKENKGLKLIYKMFKYGVSSVKEVLVPYNRIVERSLRSNGSNYKKYPCVMPSWDNTARRDIGATIYVDSSPEKYSNWLVSLMQKFKPYSKDENLIFINSWNEWAEGSNLEPDLRFGRSFLEAHKKGIEKYQSTKLNHKL